MAEGDELVTGVALLLSCPVLIQTVLACWQGRSKGTSKELCLRFFLVVLQVEASEAQESVCSVEQLSSDMADGAIKPGETQPESKDLQGVEDVLARSRGWSC